MKKWDERARVRDAIRCWLANYGPDGSYGSDKRGRAVGRELLALDPETATAAQVTEIIGNDSWAGPLACSQCGARTYDIVQVGQPEDYDSGLCRECLSSALKMLEAIA